MKKKLALLVVAIAGVFAMAQTCTLLGATVVVIDDDVWYSAEIRNDTNADILNHSMAVGFIDGADLAVSRTVDQDPEDIGVVCLRSLQSGESNFFSANSKLDDNDVTTAVSRLVGPITFGEVVPSDLTFSNIEVTRNGETLVITGRIKNNDNDTIDDLRVCAVVRNEDGDVTRVDVDNEIDGVDEDETVEFSLTTTVPNDPDDVDVVDLYADGVNADDDDKVIEPVEDLDNAVELCAAATNTPTRTSTGTVTPSNTPTSSNTPTATSTGTVTATPSPTATPDDAC